MRRADLAAVRLDALEQRAADAAPAPRRRDVEEPQDEPLVPLLVLDGREAADLAVRRRATQPWSQRAHGANTSPIE